MKKEIKFRGFRIKSCKPCEYSQRQIEKLQREVESLNKELDLQKAVIEMPLLPDGLDDDSNCDHNFKLGWIACWNAYIGNKT